MHPVFAYLVKMLLCSTILLGYYWVALRNERFHEWNRFYLLSAMFLSVLVPFLNIPLLMQEKPPVVVTVVASLPWNQLPLTKATAFSWKDGLLLVTAIVSLVMLLHLITSVLRIISMYKTHTHTYFKEVSVVITEEQTAPFSFFKWLFWRSDIDPDSENGQRMLQHELTHISEKHSADKLFTELVLIVFWMNPFFWIMRRELYAIHEFLADQKAIERHDGAAFASMILQAAHAAPTHILSNPFFTSHLKRRLIMITTSHAPKYSYLRRISGLVLMITTGAILVLSIEHANAQKPPPPPPTKKVAPPPPPAPPDGQWTELPDSIKSAEVIDRKGVCYIKYNMKDGRQLIYELNKAKEKGYFIPPPPPPAPPAPVAPKSAADPADPEDKFTINADGKTPMYIYAGLEITEAQMKQIDPNRIARVDVLKGERALKEFGEKGKYGVVKITPKQPDEDVVTGYASPGSKGNKETVVVGYSKKSDVPPGERSLKLAAADGKPAPLYFINGKEASSTEANALPANSIEAINVLKGRQATDKYGVKGENGVIEITTKDEGAKEVKPNNESKNDNIIAQFPFNPYDRSYMRPSLNFEDGKIPLIILNGKEISLDQLKKIDPRAINAIDITNDANMIKSYGSKARYGILTVRTNAGC